MNIKVHRSDMFQIIQTIMTDLESKLRSVEYQVSDEFRGSDRIQWEMRGPL